MSIILKWILIVDKVLKHLHNTLVFWGTYMSVSKHLIISLIIVALIIAPLLTALMSSNVIVKASPEPTLPLIIGSGDEGVRAYTIILRKGASQGIANEIRDAVKTLLTSVTSKGAKGLGAGVSRAVNTKDGRYMFRVVGDPKVVKDVVAKYSRYIEAVIALPKPQIIDVRAEELLEANESVPTPTNFIIRELIGVTNVEQVYGFNGSDITIAIVDTGVDYGHPDIAPALRYWEGTYWNAYGNQVYVREPLVLDADESQVVLLQTVYKYNATHIKVGDMVYTTYTPWPVVLTPSCYYYKVPPDVMQQAKEFRFGLTDAPHPVLEELIVGVLMYRFANSSTFDYTIIDLNNNCDFSDDPILSYWSDRIIAADYDGDGVPDISLGVAGGFFYDWFWNFGYLARIYPGWDQQGNYLSIFYDFNGHGTACASAAAGRGNLVVNVPGFGLQRLTGMAPGAMVIGVKALWAGNVEAGMLWAAGFDIDPQTGQWFYTGSKRADIVSNSWGVSYFTYDISGFGVDYLSIIENALTTPGFLDPNYPGIVIVHAGGNGGPGFGTITAPGAAPGVITVGASTSLHPLYGYANASEAYAYLYMTAGGWSADEIVTWALRGPTPLGYVKPDVVNVGMFGYTAYVIPRYSTMFSGTSYATPLTAGAVALVLQVLGKDADPSLVKAILQSSAAPLGYEGASQGFGRVDAFRAVSLALLLKNQTSVKDELLISTNSLWRSYAEKYGETWQWYWCDYIKFVFLYYGNTITPATCGVPQNMVSRIDGAVFFGDVGQGESKSVTLTIVNPTNKTVAVTLTPLMYKILKIENYTVTLSVPAGYSYSRRMLLLRASDIVSGARLLVAVASMPYTRFDSNDNYRFDARVRIWIHLWLNDTNANGVPDPSETVLINYGYNYANWNLATMSLPLEKLGNYTGILVTIDLVRGPDTPSTQPVPDTPITVSLMFIGVEQDPWVSVKPETAVISPKSSASFTVTVTVPTDAIPTTYIGEVLIANNVTGYVMQVPYSFNVYTEVGTEFKVISGSVGGRWPDPGSLGGCIDWAWRFESGDWRLYHIKPATTNALAFEVQAKWSYENTSLIGFALGPNGMFAGIYLGEGASWFLYNGSGIFTWINTGAPGQPNAKRIVFFPAVNYRDWLYPHSKPETGVFTIVIRTALYDGGAGWAEPITAEVRTITANYMMMPRICCGAGYGVLQFVFPYPVDNFAAVIDRPATPYLDPDQLGVPGSYTITPSSGVGPYPENSTYTFIVYAENYGSPGQKFDIVSLLIFDISSLPVVKRVGGIYSVISTSYAYEDWTRVVAGMIGVVTETTTVTRVIAQPTTITETATYITTTTATVTTTTTLPPETVTETVTTTATTTSPVTVIVSTTYTKTSTATVYIPSPTTVTTSVYLTAYVPVTYTTTVMVPTTIASTVTQTVTSPYTTVVTSPTTVTTSIPITITTTVPTTITKTETTTTERTVMRTETLRETVTRTTTATVTSTTTTVSPVTITSISTSTSTVTETQRVIDIATTVGVGVLLLVLGFAIGMLLGRPRR
jgi:subtilisin family serine protease